MGTGPVLGDQQGSARLYRFVSRFYDVLRPLFAGFQATREQYHSFLELGPSDRILDLGCGTGESTRPLIGDGREVCGIDLSARQLTQARRKEDLSPVSFILGDGMALPFRANRFDAVTSVGSLQHVPDVSLALEEAHRVTRPGGRLFVVGPKRPESRVGGAIADALMHFMVPEEMRSMARAAGYVEVETHLVHMDYLARDALVLTGRA
ncbi:MAG: class I SAM-dependent methyltransferase [Halodesulfurarchaeum sp.]